MKDFPKLIISVAACELVGVVGIPFTIVSIPTWYTFLSKPSFSPPNWIFGPVWTILYFLMGISLYLILIKGMKKKEIRQSIRFFIAQLVCNFLWSLFFFGLHSPVLGLIDSIFLLSLILLTVKTFYTLSKPAAYLLVPYLLWVSFALILNIAIIVLNP
ncbi:MAG TPA: TspO/MBR family protein [Candidatus Saccharimonadales bacterium]|nr:TspO/MBR family protein [Candidatus Saccharimonadales bacterium]